MHALTATKSSRRMALTGPSQSHARTTVHANGASLALLLSLLAPLPSFAQDQSVNVDDLQVFFGVVPAEVLGKRTPMGTEAKEHENRRRFRSAQHLVVAILDAKTGRHVEDATVIAAVTPLGLSQEQKQLQPMRINDSISYGGYFTFNRSSGPFRISLDIARPKTLHHQRADFSYSPPDSR